MHFLICMDSWKGSLDALEACKAVGRGIQAVLPDSRVSYFPLADGGEGTLERMVAAGKGEVQTSTVTGPFPGEQVEASWLYQPNEKRAFIEMAVCAGLPLLTPEQRDPMRTTTRGVGELMQKAVEKGATSITLAVGGSATVDGGCGMASALGWQFLDEEGSEIPDGGGALRSLKSIIAPETAFPAEVRVMCDVTNLLLGPKGSSPVFGPQKGAFPEQVLELEKGLTRLSDRWRTDIGKDVREIEGGGAAGGIAAGAVAFFGAELVPGAEEVIRLVGMDQALDGADAVITGEGRLDGQSLDGKVVSAVLLHAGQHQVPVSVIAGSCTLSEEECQAHQIQFALSANEQGLPLEEAMRRAGELAEGAGARLAGLFLESTS